ncbi:MAG: hypothetical protein WC755_04900 [Candidatus Woesearchaeota archaeon]|jgi:hypothetical protein
MKKQKVRKSAKKIVNAAKRGIKAGSKKILAKASPIAKKIAGKISKRVKPAAKKALKRVEPAIEKYVYSELIAIFNNIKKETNKLSAKANKHKKFQELKNHFETALNHKLVKKTISEAKSVLNSARPVVKKELSKVKPAVKRAIKRVVGGARNKLEAKIDSIGSKKKSPKRTKARKKVVSKKKR